MRTPIQRFLRGKKPASLPGGVNRSLRNQYKIAKGMRFPRRKGNKPTPEFSKAVDKINIPGRILHQPIRILTKKGFRLNPAMLRDGQAGLRELSVVMNKNGIKQDVLTRWLGQKVMEYYIGPGVGADAPAILALLNCQESIPVLEKALQRPKAKNFGNNEYEIIRALNILGSRSSARLFIKLLKSPNIFVDWGPRLEMIKFFGHFRVREAVPVLKEQLRLDYQYNSNVVGQSLIALAHINPETARREIAAAQKRVSTIQDESRRREFKEYLYWASEIANGGDTSRLRSWMQ
ncbi:MAG: hypothetical protein V1776_01705 [Candidatus Diapherotrites archaeon]